MLSAVTWLAAQQEGTVFSHYTRGYFIHQQTGFPVFADSMSVQNTNRSEISFSLFYGRNLPSVEEQLLRYNITYIMIDKKMREGLVWERDGEGLLFLLKNKKAFSLLYDKGDVQIYRFEN